MFSTKKEIFTKLYNRIDDRGSICFESSFMLILSTGRPSVFAQAPNPFD